MLLYMHCHIQEVKVFPPRTPAHRRVYFKPEREKPIP